MDGKKAPLFILAVLILLPTMAACSRDCRVQLEIRPAGGGEVIGAGEYPCETTVRLEAEPAEGFRFIGFIRDGELISEETVHQFELDGDVQLVAEFVELVQILIDPELGGEVQGAGAYVPGEEVVLRARPEDGYEFAGWMEGDRAVSRKETHRFPASESRHLTAIFRRSEPERVVDPDAQLMGQPVDARTRLRPAAPEAEGTTLGVSAGSDYVVAWDGTAGELVLLRHGDLQKISRLPVEETSPEARQWEGFFWGELFVLVIPDASRGLVAVHRVSEEGIVRVWEREMAGARADLVGGSDGRHLVAHGRVDGEIFPVTLLARDGAEVTEVWRGEEGMRIGDLIPYREEGLLLADIERGWLLLTASDPFPAELGVGGAAERAAWESLGRRPTDGMRYRLHGADHGGAVIASMDGVLSDGEDRDRFGAYYQLWVPEGDGMTLVAESFLTETEGGGTWFSEADRDMGSSFRFHPRTGRWLSWRGLPIDVPDAGGHYFELQLDREAAERAAQDGPHGSAARISASGRFARPLGDLLRPRTRFGYRSNRDLRAGDFAGAGNLDLLLQRADGIHLLTGGGEVGAVRLAGAKVNLVGVHEGRREVYFSAGGELLRLSGGDLLDVRRGTAYPSREALWSARVRGEIAALTVAGDDLFVLDVDRARQRTYLRAHHAGTGEQIWAVEVDPGGPRHVAAVGDTVRAVDGSGRLRVIDARTGDTLAHPVLETETDPVRVHLMMQARLYVSEWVGGTGRFSALCADSGRKLWHLDIPGLRVDEAVHLEDHIVVSAGDMGEGFLFGIEPETGEVVFEYDTGIGGAVPPLKENGLLISGGHGAGDDAFLFALDWDTGEERWRFEAGYKALVTPPAIRDGVLYTLRFTYGPLDGVLTALHLFTGEELWTNEERDYSSGPVSAGGRLHLTDADLYLYGVDADTGEIEWKFNPGVSTELAPPGYLGIGPHSVVEGDILYYPAAGTIHAIAVDP